MTRHMANQVALAAVAAFVLANGLAAQAPLPSQAAPPYGGGPPPSYDRGELERIVSPIALYPDQLLAQVLAAATFPSDVADAADWSEDHRDLVGNRLTDAIYQDSLPWDPSVQALLPFPRVLRMMASDRAWTEELGNAFLGQHDEVMDAVQRMRHRAWDYGYLRPSSTVIVRGGPFIEILAADPAFVVVPYYNPAVVFAPHRRGVVFASAINWGFGIRLGVGYAPWGWGSTRFGWATHTVFINNAPWGRTWGNRVTYVHPYTVRRYERTVRPVERHTVQPREARDRERERDNRRDDRRDDRRR